MSSRSRRRRSESESGSSIPENESSIPARSEQLVIHVPLIPHFVIPRRLADDGSREAVTPRSIPRYLVGKPPRDHPRRPSAITGIRVRPAGLPAIAGNGPRGIKPRRSQVFFFLIRANHTGTVYRRSPITLHRGRGVRVLAPRGLSHVHTLR